MDIRTYLEQHAPLVFDGAMGTYFAARRGHSAEIPCEQANLDSPAEILAIHREYLQAGCRAIKTNTFSAGAFLAQWEEERCRAVIEAGCRLALEAAEPYQAFVFADIGPAWHGENLSPARIYERQVDLFLEMGLRHFLAETLPGDEGVEHLAVYLKQRCPDAFLLVSFAVQPDGATRDGHIGQALYTRTAALPQVDSVGFNCVSGPHHLLEYIKRLERSDKPLCVMPNAGYPTVLGRRTVYQGLPDYFARQMARIVQAGAGIVGGCCGTTPAHIAAMVQALRTPLPPIKVRPAAKPQAAAPSPAANSLWDKLEAGRRVIAVELDPPADADIAPFLEGAKAIWQAGADAVTIADCPVGRTRADSSLLACKLKRDLGIEPLPHMTCRDRNLNATKALLLGLSMEGVHNVLLVTGDPIPTADRDEVKSVFNFNSRKLARYVTGLNETVLPTPFRVYGALNLNARNFQMQLKLAQEKEENGVSAFLTQPVLSPQALENLKLARSALKGKILGGIFPVVSYRNACFLNNEVAGIHVCDEILALYQDKNREQGEALAVEISQWAAHEMAPFTDGFYLMTPFRRIALITEIIRLIR